MTAIIALNGGIMRFVLLALISLVILVGCTTQPIRDTMLICKQLCRGDVSTYQDDTVNCACKERK